jgi:DNA-binding NarL/FixJ family response regulator
MAALIVDGSTKRSRIEPGRHLAARIAKIQLFLVESQKIVRKDWKTILENKSDLQVVGEAENAERAIARLQVLQGTAQFPDLVLTDVQMSQQDGATLTQRLCQQFPNLRILILTAFDDPQYVAAALHDGAKGYLLRDTPAEELARAIRSIYQGYTQFGPGLLERAIARVSIAQSELPSELSALTKREREVLQLVAQGANNREIAEALFLSPGTVRNHISNILSRLNVRDRTQAAIIAHTIAA